MDLIPVLNIIVSNALLLMFEFFMGIFGIGVNAAVSLFSGKEALYENCD